MKKKEYKIAVIKGDGIGPDVINEALKLLKHLDLSINFVEAFAGFETYQKEGTSLPEDTINVAKNSDAILFGAVTSPPNIKDYFSPIVRLRKVLDLYANIRPIFSLPVPSSNQGISFTIFRENTEDLYMGRERLTVEGAVAERVITKKGSERILRSAFEYARKHKKKTITVVHKANVLRLTDGLFLSTAQDVSKSYNDIEMEDLLVDNCAMQLVRNASRFEVIVTTNMFGDILSDEAAALVGGLGVVASANIGESTGVFEPVHGSAPKYAGKNTANPLATFFATSMMLDYLGETTNSKRINDSISICLKNGDSTKDLGGTLSTTKFTDYVIQNLKSL